MNDPFVVQQAKLWAKRILGGPSAANTERVMAAYQTAFGRMPNSDEQQSAEAFLATQANAHGEVKPGEKAWADLCRLPRELCGDALLPHLHADRFLGDFSLRLAGAAACFADRGVRLGPAYLAFRDTAVRRRTGATCRPDPGHRAALAGRGWPRPARGCCLLARGLPPL